MPEKCKHFGHLRRRLDELKKKFIEAQLHEENTDPLGFRPDLDDLAAFRLLVHAELEEFLEAKAKQNLDALSVRVKSGLWAHLSPELLTLANAFQRTLALEFITDAGRISNFAEEVLSVANTAINENNGIKTKSFTLLSICAGKSPDHVDQSISNGLNSYGKSRGDVAHKSVARCRELLAPSAELNAAEALLKQISSYFDVVE